MAKVLEQPIMDTYIRSLIRPEERLAAWQKSKGMWKHRKSDPIKELAKMRREWERKLPPLH